MKFRFGRERGFQPLRKKAVEQRAKSEKYTELEQKAQAAGVRPWTYYRGSMEDYFSPHTPGQGGGFENTFPGITQEVRTNIDRIHEQGKRALVVDLFGAADGTSLGADKTINLSLIRTEEDSDTRTFVEGNAFETGTAIKLINEIRATDAELVLVTCIPGSGLPIAELGSSNDAFPYQAIQLRKLFENVLTELHAEGIMLVKLSNEGDLIGDEFAKYLDTQDVKYEYGRAWPHVFKITKR